MEYKKTKLNNLKTVTFLIMSLFVICFLSACAPQTPFGDEQKIDLTEEALDEGQDSFSFEYYGGSASLSDTYCINGKMLTWTYFNCGDTTKEKIPLSDEEWERLKAILLKYTFNNKVRTVIDIPINSPFVKQIAGDYSISWSIAFDGITYSNVSNKNDFISDMLDFISDIKSSYLINKLVTDKNYIEYKYGNGITVVFGTGRNIENKQYIFYIVPQKLEWNYNDKGDYDNGLISMSDEEWEKLNSILLKYTFRQNNDSIPKTKWYLGIFGDYFTVVNDEDRFYEEMDLFLDECIK